MKYIFVYFYVFLLKIIDAFKPFVTKYVLTCKSLYIIKSISGLFKNNKNNKQIENSVSVINNKLNLEKEKIIIPGYIDHDPKAEALKKWNHKSSVKSMTTELSIGGPFSGNPFTQPGQL